MISQAFWIALFIVVMPLIVAGAFWGVVLVVYALKYIILICGFGLGLVLISHGQTFYGCLTMVLALAPLLIIEHRQQRSISGWRALPPPPPVPKHPEAPER